MAMLRLICSKIRTAIAPPPKPLSMLTTAIPEVQLVSAVFNAVYPSAEMPYPVDVGTATIGKLVSPARTTGSAPSKPWTDTIALQSLMPSTEYINLFKSFTPMSWKATGT
ncbi:hypothetical protein [Kochikohdavirus PBEF19]|uniref:Uncharacterized protein n=1 Tax=Enterococcus phage PBEF129 TaxID=2696337 RepID=A0A7T3JEP7_9CAUD|nr:hypothetical protein [Enterococcus phage PBEF129]